MAARSEKGEDGIVGQADAVEEEDVGAGKRQRGNSQECEERGQMPVEDA